MNLIEIGEALREGRERKGLTVYEVEAKIKVAPAVILALEEGNLSRLPHPVYARGFVRSYAQLLDLDAAELSAHFGREYPVPTEADHPEMHSPKITVRLHDSHQVLTAVRVGAVLGILLLGVVGWYGFQEYKARFASTAPLSQAVEAAPSASAETTPAASLPAPLTQMQEVVGNVTAGHDAENASAIEPANSTGTVPISSGEAQTESHVLPAGGTRNMVVSANASSWLKVRADGKSEEYLLRKGESATISFSKSLSIKFGNAGGVRLALDGKPFPFEAAPGEVKTLELE